MAERLPPGVLARAEGINGPVRVEEREGLRRLTIDGVVQGAAPIGQPPAISSEPVVGLLRAFRPDAKTCLVIGLGTGKTASALLAAGLELDVAEIEPAVVAFARRFFDYRGPATVSDGLAFAKTSTKHYDLILIDADLGTAIPQHLVSDEALAIYGARASSDGLLIVRVTASPNDAQPAALFRRMRGLRQMFGTGVGAEEQNLFLLSSGGPLFAEDLTHVAAWPVVIPGSDSARVPKSTGTDGMTRDVTVLGYVIRTRDGSLCLDLPHWQMGAVRYVLSGDKADELGKRLPRDATFPTLGLIGSDDDTSHTLALVFGGGGALRSDVRFSPLVAKVSGRIRARAVTDPDDAYVEHGPRRVHPLLPYGGVLYEMDVASVDWTFDEREWLRLRQSRLSPLLSRATIALQAGELAKGVAAMVAYRKVIEESFGAQVDELPLLGDIDRAISSVRNEGTPVDDFSVAAACDRTAYDFSYSITNTDVHAISRALLLCAVGRYRKALSGPRASTAAGRLKSILAFYAEPIPEKNTLLQDVRRRFPDIEDVPDPPPRQPAPTDVRNGSTEALPRDP